MGNFFSIKQNNNNFENDDKFWKFYGILIPYNITSIPSIDGVNYIHNKNGGISETLVGSIDDCSYTLKEYQKKYAIKINGKLYWKQ